MAPRGGGAVRRGRGCVSSPDLRSPGAVRQAGGIGLSVLAERDAGQFEGVREEIEGAKRPRRERCAREDGDDRVRAVERAVRGVVLGPLAAVAEVVADSRGDEEVAGPLRGEERREREGRVRVLLPQRPGERLARRRPAKAEQNASPRWKRP